MAVEGCLGRRWQGVPPRPPVLPRAVCVGVGRAGVGFVTGIGGSCRRTAGTSASSGHSRRNQNYSRRTGSTRQSSETGFELHGQRMGAVTMTGQSRRTGLPGSLSNPEQATRSASDGRTVGAPNNCRDLRSAGSCGAVLPHTGGRAPSGHVTRGGVPAATWHTTQGTSAGPVDTGKPAGLVTCRWVDRWGSPGEQR